MADSFHIENISTADLPEGGFRTALKFWLEAKCDHRLPPASAINPVKLPRALLSRLIVVSVEPGPKRLRFRLVGTAIVDAVGYDFTGRFGEDVEGAGPTNERFYRTMETKTPYFYGGPLTWSPFDFKRYKSLVMPFGDEQNAVVRFLSYTQFEA